MLFACSFWRERSLSRDVARAVANAFDVAFVKCVEGMWRRSRSDRGRPAERDSSPGVERPSMTVSSCRVQLDSFCPRRFWLGSSIVQTVRLARFEFGRLLMRGCMLVVFVLPMSSVVVLRRLLPRMDSPVVVMGVFRRLRVSSVQLDRIVAVPSPICVLLRSRWVIGELLVDFAI